MRKEADDIGPTAELEHWKKRMAKFNAWVQSTLSKLGYSLRRTSNLIPAKLHLSLCNWTLSKADTSLKWTVALVPRLSALERVDCTSQHGSGLFKRLSFSWLRIRVFFFVRRLLDQIKSPHLKATVGVLHAAKSRSLKHWKELVGHWPAIPHRTILHFIATTLHRTTPHNHHTKHHTTLHHTTRHHTTPHHTTQPPH